MSSKHSLFENEVKLLSVKPWKDWHKEAIKKVIDRPVFLEAETDGPVSELALEANFIYGTPGVNPSALAQSENLWLVQLSSTGADKYMVPEFQQSDIILINSKGVHGPTVADHAMALLLGLARGFAEAYANRASKRWGASGSSIVNLDGKTAGLLGLGAIGVEIAKRCKAFGMQVIGNRRNSKPTEFVDEVYASSGLDEVLSKSDFVVCSLPLTEETHHLLTLEKFSLMKQSAFFVNVGRGPVVREEDMIAALSRGIIKGAGLDVFETEPLSKESPLWEMTNVIITPHSAGFEEEHAKKTFDIFLENLSRYKRGESLINHVDKKLGY